MDDPALLDLIDQTPPGELAAILDDLPPAYRQALDGWLADVSPASTVEYVDAPDPHALARRLIPGWRTRPHLELLAGRYAHVAETGGRLIVNLPPQYGKSAITSRWGPAWYLDRWPGRRVIMTSYAESLIRDRSREVRDTFTTSEGLHTTVRTGVATQTRWDTTDGGGMIAAGIGGALTGHGAHLFVIDDPFKDWEEAHSHAARDRVWNFWRAVATTRLAPGSGVVVTMTRWHEDDLTGRLLSGEHEGDPDEWEVLRIPALSEGDQDPLGRPEGTPLYRPDVEQTEPDAIAWLESKKRDAGPYLWNGMYQQRPGAAQGTIFKRGWWQIFRTVDGDEITPGTTIDAGGEHLPVRQMRIVQSWDMAFKETAGSSFVVGQVWGVPRGRPADRFLLDQVRDRLGFSATKQAVKDLRDKWPMSEVAWVEDKANGPAVMDELRSTVESLVPSTPSGSKVARAWSVQGVVEAGNVWIPSTALCPWVSDWIDELAQFPDAAHDDQVDAFTQAMIELRGRGRTSVSVPTGSRSQAGGRTRQTQRRIQR